MNNNNTSVIVSNIVNALSHCLKSYDNAVWYGIIFFSKLIPTLSGCI